jgi:hypothetical protein
MYTAKKTCNAVATQRARGKSIKHRNDRAHAHPARNQTHNQTTNELALDARPLTSPRKSRSDTNSRNKTFSLDHMPEIVGNIQPKKHDASMVRSRRGAAGGRAYLVSSRRRRRGLGSGRRRIIGVSWKVRTRRKRRGQGRPGRR